MKNFKINLIKAAMLSSGLVIGVTPNLMAQESAADQPTDETTEVIVVSGIRGSLQRAQAIKMDNTSIVEALSAEDIGKLPDTSIAESLGRLPGLAGERRNGRTSGLSVRGFNENYVGTSLNGRELLGMGDNRGVEYDLYPSEIVSDVLVYKTPEAGLIVQGLGGTVDLQTISPLGKERTITFNGTYEQNGQDSGNPDFDDNGHRLAFSFVDSFADDTLGVALTLASMESPSQEQQFRGWGYDTVASGVDGPGNITENTTVLGGHDSFVRSAMMERDSVALVVEWQPTDKLNIQLDALYIDFQEDKVFRGIEEAIVSWAPDNYTVTEVEDDLVLAGTTKGFHSVIRNDAESKEAELTTFGLNLEYEINTDWTAEVDISTGEVDKLITNIESYSGVGRPGSGDRPTAARSWRMTPTGAMYSDHPSIAPVDYTDPSLIKLAGPQAWGGSLDPVARFNGNPDFAPNTAQDGFVNNPSFTEELDAVRFEVHGFVEWGIFSKLNAGIAYNDRTMSKDNNGAYLTAPVWPDAELVSDATDVLGSADLSFIGINGVIAYDSLGLYNSGYYISTPAEDLETGRLGDTYTVEEELVTLFAKLDIDTEVGGMFLRGNVGVQVVSADQQALGFDSYTGPDRYVLATPVSGGDDYTDVLPTLNLSLEVAERQFIKTGLSKVLTRPRMDDMRPNNTVSFDFNDSGVFGTTPATGPWSGSTGSPNLKPIEANQFDLSYEHYFEDEGYMAVAFFYKDLKNWHESVSIVQDFSEFYIPGYHQSSGNHDLDGDGVNDGPVPPTVFEGPVTSRADGLTGFVRGWELQGSLPFGMVHESLDGFGLVASATFLDGMFDGEFENPDDARIPGLSEESYSLTAYYENSGFEIRIAATKRSEFLSETRGISLSLVGATNQGAELVDAQIGYDFSESGIEYLEGLRITLQGQNLTDEETIQTSGTDSRQVTQYQSFGRNFLLGFNYSF
ncbi:TonB-dependent receptor [Alteromonas sp. ASW11-130]|uniref:TonB-dependent receptor n=1 Tax=Alteromonas sp. ASW11-130 TaxID=3015775 RepID=UPI002241EA41|nr:TonB-dependent receptor [Alteromonas sp. ASW11-130]MCW8090953.1 TonB-dependent receptor [Alteromonas sp. ASW11-130]